MENIVLKYKNFEVIENENALFELRKDGRPINNSIDNINSLFETIQFEEEKERKKSLIREKINNINEKSGTIRFLNEMTNLNIREISYEELIDNRTGFSQRGFLVNDGNIKRLLSKEELIDMVLSFYNEQFANYFELRNNKTGANS